MKISFWGFDDTMGLETLQALAILDLSVMLESYFHSNSVIVHNRVSEIFLL